LRAGYNVSMQSEPLATTGRRLTRRNSRSPSKVKGPGSNHALVGAVDTDLNLDPFALFDQLGDSVVIVDRDWRVTALSATAEQLCRHPDNDVIGTSFWDVWPGSLSAPLKKQLTKAMAERHSPVAATHNLAFMPADVWLELRASPYENGLAIVARDVSAQRRREVRAGALQELTAALSAAVDPAEVATAIIEQALPSLGAIAGNVYLLGEEGRELVSVAARGYEAAVLEGSRRLPLDSATMMAEVVRTSAPIVIGTWAARLLRYPHHRDVHARGDDRAVAGLPLKVEGRTIGALSLAFPTDRDFGEDELGFMATVADLCAQALARTRLYEALRRSEAQARMVTDRAPTYLAHIDVERRYRYVNRGFAARLGLTPEDVVGKQVPEIIGEAAYEVVREYLDRVLAGEEVEFEAILPYAVIGSRFVQVAYAPDRDERGQVQGAVAVITDATERRHAEFARQLLADAGALLGSSLDPERTLEEIARVTVPAFADLCVTWILEDGVLRRVGVTPSSEGQFIDPPPLPDTLASLPRNGANSQPSILSAGPLTTVTVPLHAHDHLAGALQFILTDPHRRFAIEDIWLADELGRRCAAALENSQLYQSLQESEARFRQLADALPSIAWVTGPTGNILDYVNQRWLDQIGVPLAPGTTPLANDCIHPDDRADVEDRWNAALRDGASFVTEMRLRVADLSHRWFLYRTEPVRDATGKVTKWFGAATDIDDTKRAEAFQRFLAELSSTLAISLDPTETLRRVAKLVIPTLADYCFIDLVDPDGQIRRVAWAHVAPAGQRLLDENLTRLLPEAFDPDHPISQTIETGAPLLIAKVDDAWMEKIAFSAEHLAFIHSLGPRSRLTVPLRARGRTLGALTLCYGDVSGRRYGAETLDQVRDVAERIAFAVDNARLYREAREAEATVRRLLDAGIVGIVVAEADQILEANDHFLEMVGYTRAELQTGRLRWSAMTPPEFADLDASGLAELEALGVSAPYEKECIRRDGSRMPILTGAALLEHHPLRWIGFVLDLTERKRGEDEWRAFIDATAHDLRNPLTSVLGQTQLMQRRLQRDGALAPDDAGSRLATIASSAVRAAGLIDDLIDTARLRAGQPLEMRPEPIDLIALVETCADEARRVGPSHVIRVEATAAALKIVADESRIERVIRNMLDNAIKFSPDGGEVIARARRVEDESGPWAVLAIEDRGLGIPAGDLAYVFERFRRGANVEGRIHGSGIGLTGAQQIVAQHGGSIAVESTEGVGSTFTLRLPLLP
jgi:PAS domain S-box-containing protein